MLIVCSVEGCGKEFKDSEGRRKKCHACRMGKVKCARDGCSKTIYKASARVGSGYCKSCLNKMEANPNWRGGKITTQGYTQLRQPDGSYVFEHRLVMAEKLGRPLLDNENVHHKNGIKTDNRIENLELWVTSQPSGQRAEDLVQWAQEIIELYGAASKTA